MPDTLHQVHDGHECDALDTGGISASGATETPDRIAISISPRRTVALTRCRSTAWRSDGSAFEGASPVNAVITNRSTSSADTRATEPASALRPCSSA